MKMLINFDTVSQACAFKDSYEKFKKAGAEVVGISGDDTSSHKVVFKTIFHFLIIYSTVLQPKFSSD